MILFLLILVQMHGEARQKEWTLRECIDHALEHNITVRQSALNVEQKEIDLNTAKGRRLPGVSASGSESLSFGRGLSADNTYTNSNTSSTSFNLGMDVPVFQGLQISNGVKMGRLDLEAAMADLAKAKDDIRVSVAQAYVQILYNQELLKVAVSQEEHDGMLLYQMEEKKKVVEMTAKLANRSVNEGFSGGEKKKNEIFQMAMLDPIMSFLDETDSGLDIDALRIVANGVNKLRSSENAIVVITHYQRLLDYIVPDFVHVLYEGKIVKSGTKELALELESKGYEWIREELESKQK